MIALLLLLGTVNRIVLAWITGEWFQAGAFNIGRKYLHRDEIFLTSWVDCLARLVWMRRSQCKGKLWPWATPPGWHWTSGRSKGWPPSWGSSNRTRWPWKPLEKINWSFSLNSRVTGIVSWFWCAYKHLEVGFPGQPTVAHRWRVPSRQCIPLWLPLSAWPSWSWPWRYLGQNGSEWLEFHSSSCTAIRHFDYEF